MKNVEELVTAAQAGDQLAFSQLVRAEARWSYATARVVLGAAADVEDVFQDACLRAWRDLATLRRPDLWSFWFRRIVTHAAIDAARRRARIRAIQLQPARVERDKVDHIADRDAVFRMLETLPPDERALLVLRFGHDLGVPDVARVMGLPLGTTKSKLHRVLLKLRDAGGRTP